MRTRSATALHHRALVGLGEVDLLGGGVAAEALHLQDLALPREALAHDQHADEDEHERNAEKDAGEVEDRADGGSDDQDCENYECDLHEGAQSMRSGLRLAFAVASLRVLAGLESLEALVAGALRDRPGSGVALEALVVGGQRVDVAADGTGVARG